MSFLTIRPPRAAARAPLHAFVQCFGPRPTPFSTHMYAQYSTKHSTKGLFRVQNWAPHGVTPRVSLLLSEVDANSLMLMQMYKSQCKYVDCHEDKVGTRDVTVKS